MGEDRTAEKNHGGGRDRLVADDRERLLDQDRGRDGDDAEAGRGDVVDPSEGVPHRNEAETREQLQPDAEDEQNGDNDVPEAHSRRSITRAKPSAPMNESTAKISARSANEGRLNDS